MSELGNLNPIVGGINAASNLISGIFGNKAEKEDNIHSEQMAAENALAADAAAQQRDNRTWWDSFVDGLNRLPRPIMAFLVIGAMLWAPINPIKFAAVMEAYRVVPQWLALVFGQIIAMFFGGRMLDKWSMAPANPADITETISNIKTLNDMAKKPLEAPPVANSSPATTPAAVLEKVVPASSNELAKELVGSKPMSLPAIVEWNKKNNPDFKG